MAPIVLTLIQVAFLVLLYLFVGFTARAVLRDLRGGQPAHVASSPPAPVRTPAPAPGPGPGPAPQRMPAGPAPRSVRSPRGPARELVVHAAGSAPRVLPLDSGDVTFGRSQQSTVPLNDSYASERHARIYREGDQWLLADLGSTNGTYLNKARVDGPTPIGPGDQVAIGKTIVEVRK